METPIKIILPKEFIELGEIKCLEPIEISVTGIHGNTIYYEWDFGMEQSILSTSIFLDICKKKSPEEIVLSVAKFDIGHAFFHYDQDPNYSPAHWAIKGWLRNRIEAKEL